MAPTLETNRLILRPVEISDAPRYQALFANFEVIEFLDGTVIPWPYPENGAEEWIKIVTGKMDESAEVLWVLVPKEGGGMIGALHLNPSGQFDHRGFWLGREYWGQGFMSEAVFASQDYCFDVLGMPELLLSNAEPNAGSARLKEKSGAEFLGFTEEKYFAGGGTYRSMKWRLSAEAWRSVRGSL